MNKLEILIIGSNRLVYSPDPKASGPNKILKTQNKRLKDVGHIHMPQLLGSMIMICRLYRGSTKLGGPGRSTTDQYRSDIHVPWPIYSWQQLCLRDRKIIANNNIYLLKKIFLIIK